MYQSLTGVYIIFASLTVWEQSRHSNVFPLILGPYGSSFKDIVTTLSSLSTFDRGVELQINGEMKFVCAYTLSYIGDMPQQQDNSGFKR